MSKRQQKKKESIFKDTRNISSEPKKKNIWCGTKYSKKVHHCGYKYE